MSDLYESGNKGSVRELLSSSRNFVDTIVDSEMSLGESYGIKTGSGSAGAEGSSLSRFVDAVYNAFSEEDVGKLIVVFGSSNGNDGVYIIKDYISATEVELLTDLAASESGLTWRLHNEPNHEDEHNYERTQFNRIIGNPAGNWFDNVPKYFDPSNTSGADAKNGVASLYNIAQNWYGTKTKIIPVKFDNSGAGYSQSTGGTYQLLDTTIRYATPDNRNGLVIYASTSNPAAYQDLGEIDERVKVDIIDQNTKDEFFGSNGKIVFGRLHDGADFSPSGIGDGSNVAVKFYTEDGAYTWDAADPAAIYFKVPQRKRRIDLNEYDSRQEFISGTLGDAETSQDIAEIRSGLGLADGESSGDWEWDNTTNHYALATNPATIEDAINRLNDVIGSRLYDDENVVTDGESITDSINELDKRASTGGAKSVIFEFVSVAIPRGSIHSIPFAQGSDVSITTYKRDTAGFGRYLQISVAGDILYPLQAGDPRTGDYEEYGAGSTSTQIVFRMAVARGQNIKYEVLDDA